MEILSSTIITQPQDEVWRLSHYNIPKYANNSVRLLRFEQHIGRHTRTDSGSL